MKKRRDPYPFVGVDGEGGDLNGRHFYLLLRVGDEVLETGMPLTYQDTLPWLASLPVDREYVSFFFDYDVTMILRELPVNRLKRLLDREGRTPSEELPPVPVDVGGYQIDYLPKKEFRVRRKPRSGETVPWVVINDTGTFFQCAFLTALKRWSVGTDELWEEIGKGKEQRAEFGKMTPEIRKYNGLEIELLEDLMESFRHVCEEVGYVPKRWQGPGNLASAMLRRHGVVRSKDLEHLPKGLLQYAISAYYGGRFETSIVGDVQGPVFQYDINSAYPYACTLLPCLVHSVWRKVSVPTQRLYVAEVEFRYPKDRLLYGLPIRRKNGSIHYPQRGYGWYWSHELESATRSGAEITVRSAWQCFNHCDCKPFDFVEPLYAERIRLGKTNKGMVIKLALNSLYGKTAQSIGNAPFANPVWAGLITSITRSMLADAYRSAPEACFMLATDGVFSGVELPLVTGKGLGEWDLKVHEAGMFVIQPGLYFAGSEKPKTRGVPMGKVFERREEFESEWRESEWSRADSSMFLLEGRGGVGPKYPSVTVPLRSFIGLRLALARGKPELAGQWIEAPKEISFDWTTKRRPWKVTRDGWGLRTFPYEGPEKTTVYRRDIGGNLTRGLERLEFDDSPDWADRLTPLD